MNNKYTYLELVIASIIILMVARYIWARELIEAENVLMQSMGLPSYFKYFITAPLVAFMYYRIFQREKVKAKRRGVPLVSKGILIFAVAGISVH
jgi:hypothetical protein